jgi:hypothetical protein
MFITRYTRRREPGGLTLSTRAAGIVESIIVAVVTISTDWPGWVAYFGFLGVPGVARALALDMVDGEREHFVGRSQSVSGTAQHDADDENRGAHSGNEWSDCLIERRMFK